MKKHPSAGCTLFLFAFCILCGRFCFADGTIEGIVVFPGETPPPAMFTNHDDPQCPPGIAQNNLKVNQESLGLQNAVVILDSKEIRAPEAAPMQITFDHCVLRPRVQWAPIGASLSVTNKDSSAHRIQIQSNGVMFVNEELAPNSPAIRRPLMHAGLNHLQCGRHLWESAWIYVSPNPYVVVTAEGGVFKMLHVPDGRYHIRAWHEGWKDLGPDDAGRPHRQPMEDNRTITVKDGQTTTIRFDQLQPTF